MDGRDAVAAEEVVVDVPALLRSLDGALTKNESLRARHPTEPDKFMESELAVDEAVKALAVVAAYPARFGELIDGGGPALLVRLLAHENVDVAASAIGFVAELTDADSPAELDAARAVVGALRTARVVQVLVENLARLLAERASAAVSALAALENMLGLVPPLAPYLAAETPLLEWLVTTATATAAGRTGAAGEADEVRFSASEILSIVLLAGGAEERHGVGDAVRARAPELVPRVLRRLAAFVDTPPHGTAEGELATNLLDCVRALLTAAPQQFAPEVGQRDGIATLVRLVRQRRRLYTPALKTVALALEGSPDNCTEFVAAGGLKALFHALMAKPLAGGRALDVPEGEREETCAAMVVHLFMGLAGTDLLRLVGKFYEKDFEKVARLVEMFDAYADRVAAVGKGDDDEEEDDDEVLLRRLEAGLGTLRNMALALAFVATSEPREEFREKTDELLDERDIELRAVLRVVEEYADDLVDGHAIKVVARNLLKMLA